MGFIAMSDYPILLELIHDDTVTGTYEDEWGTVDVYTIETVHYLNRTSHTYRVVVQAGNGREWTGTLNPLQEGTVKLPTPHRFDSVPLVFSLTYERV